MSASNERTTIDSSIEGPVRSVTSRANKASTARGQIARAEPRTAVNAPQTQVDLAGATQTQPEENERSTLSAAVARGRFRHRARKWRADRQLVPMRSASDADALPPAPVVLGPSAEVTRDSLASSAVHPDPVVTRAVLISSPRPQYPDNALKHGIEGDVVVLFTIDTRGAVKDAVIEQSRPAGVFDLAALRAIESARYQPRTEAGLAVVTPKVRKRFVFHVRGAGRVALAHHR
jgi:TonB family protein